ncbi:MAG: alpha/beta hydrolase [Brumimicrobium sp.]
MVIKKSILFGLFLFLLSGIAFGQKEKEVKVKTPNGKLYGSLLMPDTKKDVPVVLFIAGSGPTDRDGNNGVMKTNSYKLLAEELAKKNIGSLRFDKQGIGESADARIEESELRFEDLVKDVNSWVEYLKKKKNISEVIILGHSEGSLLGILSAQESKVDKFISVAGAGRSIDEILIEQIEVQSSEYIPEVKSIIERLKKGDTVNNVSPELNSIFRPSIQGYLISWFKYDPKTELEKVDIPYLIVQGTTDIQVKVEDAKRLNEANKNDNLIIIEGMNHILKTAPADRKENIKTYYDSKLPIHDELVDQIVEFILRT